MPPFDRLLYTGKVHTVGGRNGVSRSSDGKLDIRLSPPNRPGSGTNPEQLFAAGWSTCFGDSLRQAARTLNITPLPEPVIDAEVSLITGDAGLALRARLTISLPGVQDAVAQRLVAAAHQTCPYSRATRGNIDVVFNLRLEIDRHLGGKNVSRI